MKTQDYISSFPPFNPYFLLFAKAGKSAEFYSDTF
jgi:hypothetical protein